MDSSPVITVAHVVNSYLNEKGIYSPQNIDRFTQIVIEGYTNMNIHRTLFFRKIYLTVDSNGYVRVPADFIDYIELSLVQDNLLWPISYNKNLKFPKEGACGVEEVNEHNATDNLPDERGQVYGVGGSWNCGEFNVDYEARLISFRGARINNQEIFMRYITTGIGLTGTTYIPIQLLPVMKAYLDHIVKRNTDGTPMAVVQEAANYLQLKIIEYNNLKNKVTLAKVIEALAMGWHH